MKDEKLGDIPDALDDDGARRTWFDELWETLFDSLTIGQIMVIAEALTAEQKEECARLYVAHTLRKREREIEMGWSPRPAFSMN